jgi:putative ABC transport system permease protein
VHIRYGDRTIGLKAYDEPEQSLHYSTLDVQDRPAAEAGYELYHSPDDTVLVSDNFRLHFHKKTGDYVDLESPSGIVHARIAGVLVDFASPEGVIYMARDRYKRHWRDPLVSAFGIQLLPGFTEDQVRGEIDRRFGRERNLTVVSNAEIKRQMIEVIDQSFTYTRAIEGAALLVGLLGLLNTLLVSVMERMRELGMLRAVGMSRGQMSRMILQEAVLQGFFGAAAAVVLGSFVAYLWITHSLAHIFGWMIQFYFPWTSVLTTLALGTGVAAIASILPARRASHLEIREALEYE